MRGSLHVTSFLGNNWSISACVGSLVVKGRNSIEVAYDGLGPILISKKESL
jgi:hypothetical protein